MSASDLEYRKKKGADNRLNVMMYTVLLEEIVMSACRFAAGSSPNNNDGGLDSRGNNLAVCFACFPSCF